MGYLILFNFMRSWAYMFCRTWKLELFLSEFYWHEDNTSIYVLFQVGFIEGDGCVVQIGWKLIIITLIQTKANHQGLQVLATQRSRRKRMSLLTMVVPSSFLLFFRVLVYSIGRSRLGLGLHLVIFILIVS